MIEVDDEGGGMESFNDDEVNYKTIRRQGCSRIMDQIWKEYAMKEEECT